MIRGGEDPFLGLKEDHEHYKVYDSHYEHLGKVAEMFVDAEDQLLYIGTKTGFLGAQFILIPVEIIRVNDRRRVIEVAETKERIEHAPIFENQDEITPELEDRVRRYFGLSSSLTTPEQEFRGADAHGVEEKFASDAQIDVVPGERAEAEREFGTARSYEDQEKLREHSTAEHRPAERRRERIVPAETDTTRSRDAETPGFEVRTRRESDVPRVRRLQR